MVEVTMKNQAERANLDNRLFKLNKQLEACRKENESLSSELKILEGEKIQLSYERHSSKDLESESTTRLATQNLISAPLLVEGDEDAGIAHRKRIEDGTQNRKMIDDYLSPLIEKADDALGQEIPLIVVKGVEAKLFLRADEISDGKFNWEDFESILEEVCQEFDQDTWFDLQEAFFVAWEEIELEKIEQEYDVQSN